MKNLLRTTALLLIFNSSFLITKAQWVSIPDAAFVSYLQTMFPSCMNGNLMDTTCGAIVSAQNIYCSHRPIKDLTGMEYFDNLLSLDCSYDSLSSLNLFPPKLRIIKCEYNQITSITNLPDSTVLLFCGSNQLTALPTLPISLKSMNCYQNPITALPALPGSLMLLQCELNNLTVLPTLPASLRELYCASNQLTSIPVLPPLLWALNCGFNPLNVFPVLPNSLTWLACGSNNLTVLPVLPNTLTWLECEFNNFTTLPVLPDSLKYFKCSYDYLTSLPVLPNSLSSLDCSYNQLTTLPSLPNSLTYLNCNSNLLSSLPSLPDSLSTFYCHDNFLLTCLPHLKKIIDFNFYNTGITCLPNYPEENQTSDPALDTVLLCDPFNANTCSINWNIKGSVYNDSTSNCIKDAGETNLHNVKLKLYNNGVLAQQNFSAAYGVYSFAVNTGTYTISVDTAGLPFVVLCPASGFDTSVITPVDTLSYDRDFALQCKPGFDVGAWSVVSNNSFQPAHYTHVTMNAGDRAEFWGQNCNTNNLSGQVVTTITGAATYISPAAGALVPTVLGNVLTYNIGSWSTINPNSDFDIIVQTDTTAAINSQICFAVNVTPLAGDNNTANNNLSHCFTVVSSYDPNIKEVYPAGNIDTATHWLTYTIHFQNTGTAEAQHIYVTDTLDSNIDAASFQLLAYSHQPMVQLKGNNLRFNFPNINLPDSNTNEPLSHGYVQYKVKLKDNLPVGTNINNTAFIYFDFNAPVVTNTTSNIIALATGVANLGLRNADFGLNPNPANESVRLSIDESMVGSIVTITDITGREVLHSAVQIRNPQFDIRNLSQGVYFVTIENKTGRVTKKLVKQ